MPNGVGQPFLVGAYTVAVMFCRTGRVWLMKLAMKVMYDRFTKVLCNVATILFLILKIHVHNLVKELILMKDHTHVA